MHQCSLPFNKKSSGSTHKIWRVKSSGLNVDDKEGLAFVDKSEELIPNPKTVEEIVIGMPLKPLSIVSLAESVSLGHNQMEKGSATPILDSVQSVALRDLGFVSPPIAIPVVNKGYYLRSCSKTFGGGFGSDRDPDGIHLSVKTFTGDLGNAYSDAKYGSKAFRALYSSTVFPS